MAHRPIQIRLDEELLDRGVTLPQPRVGPYMSGLRQIVDLVPEPNPSDADRLDRPPVPDDIEIVKALVVDVVAVRLLRRLVLGRQEIVVVEHHLDAEVLFGAQPQFLKQGNRRTESTRSFGRPARCRAGVATVD